LQLREELDMAQAKTREVTRARDAAYEIVADHEVLNLSNHRKITC